MNKKVTLWFGCMSVLLSFTMGGCGDGETGPVEDDSNTGGRNTGGSKSTGGESNGDTGGTGAGGNATGGSKNTGGSRNTGGSNTGGSNTGGSNTGGTGGDDPSGGMGGMMGGMGGMVEEEPEGPVPGFNYLTNPGFEDGSTDKLAAIPGWSEDLELVASYLEASGARTGAQKLGHWFPWEQEGDWYEVSTFQTVTEIPNGTYTFSIWVMRDEWFEEQYLFATDFDDDDTALTQDTKPGFSESEYVEVKIEGIEVTNNQVTVGVYSAADGNIWANFDDASLIGE